MSWNYVYDYVDSHRDQITTDFIPSGLFVSEKPPDAGPDVLLRPILDTPSGPFLWNQLENGILTGRAPALSISRKLAGSGYRRS